MADILVFLFLLFMAVIVLLVCDALGIFGAPGSGMRFVKKVLKIEAGQ